MLVSGGLVSVGEGLIEEVNICYTYGLMLVLTLFLNRWRGFDGHL